MADSKYEYIECSIEDDVFCMILNRPKHNVMNIRMIEEINNKIELVRKNKSLKCLVLKARGASWCAGVEVLDHKPNVVHEMIDVFGRMFQLIHSLEIPTISMVHGACLGGGMELAIACDIVVATENAIFGQPEIKLGFFPPYAAVRLPHLVGQSRAIEICTRGKSYSADEALRMGMISQVVGSDYDLLVEAVDLILKDIRRSSPKIIRYNKRAIKDHFGMNFDKALSSVNSFFLGPLMNSEDVMEGIASFEEKRKPIWKNR